MASSFRREAHETEEDAGPSYGGPSQGWTALEERIFKRIDDMEVQAKSRHEEILRNHKEIRDQIRLLTERIAHMESRKTDREIAAGDNDETNVSDRASRKKRLGLNKKGEDDDEEGPRGGSDDDTEEGDDCEHGEYTTDDDEAVGTDHEEQDLAPEISSPPKIKQANSSPLKLTTAGATRGTQSTSKSPKGKRKSNDDESNTAPNNAPHKKVKIGNDVKSVAERPGSSAKSSAPTKGATPQASSKSAPAPPTGSVTEEEIKAMFFQKRPVTTKDLVEKFKSRLMKKEERDAFSAILRRIARVYNTDWAQYVLLRKS